MAGNENQKTKLLYIMKFLKKNTDENYTLSIKEIINELSKHGISAERKSIYKDIDLLSEFLLREFGLEINKEKKRPFGYYIDKRDFELSELKLLVDAVQSEEKIT